jgi:hypothetical protein
MYLYVRHFLSCVNSIIYVCYLLNLLQQLFFL